MFITKENFAIVLDNVYRMIDQKPHEYVLPILEDLYKFDSKNPAVLTMLCHVYYWKKEYAKAFHYVKKALDIDSENTQALKYKAWIYDKTGDQKNCIATLEKLITTGKGDFEVYDQYAEYLEQNHLYHSALIFYTKALQDNNFLFQVSHAAIGGGNCYSKAGAFGLAREVYDIILMEHPNDLLALHNKANNSIQSGNLMEGENICHRILQINPEFKITQQLLIDINQKKKDTKNGK